MGSETTDAERAERIEFWDEVWEDADASRAGHDGVLESVASGLAPGRALEIGCGMGGNAAWLAGQGWQVTGIDFSEVAIGKCREMAAMRGLDVEFLVEDAFTYRPDAPCQLVTAFYMQFPPDDRRRMLANMAGALAPGGTLLFVSHDKSSPPSGWDDEALESLTTPEEIVADLAGFRIERAEVIEDAGAHMSDMPEPDEEGHGDGRTRGDDGAGEHHSHGGSAVVVAVKAGD